MSMPKMYDAAAGYNKKKRISFAMPGHKGGRGIDFSPEKFDITELCDTLDLHHPNEPVKASQEFLTGFYETDLSLYLAGGSTSGIFIALAAACKRGSTVAAGRGCHISVVNAYIFLGLKMVLIPQKTDEVLNCLKCVEYDSIKCLLENYKVDAVLVTSPTYYGECADINRIAEILHEKNIPLIVDEAHGAHLKSCELLPKSAVECGADIVIHSAHKTLDALTPAAFIHLKSRLISKEMLIKAKVMRETSSPPYYLVISAEKAIEKLLSNPFSHIAEMCMAFRKSIAAETDIIMPMGENYDVTRLVLCFSKYDTTGFEVSRILREIYNIDVEAADSTNVICIATPSNTDEELEKLCHAVIVIAGLLKRKECRQFYSFDGFSEINPSESFYSEKKAFNLYKSEGMTAAEMVLAYPPGIPIIYPGETVNEKAIEYIKLLEECGAQIIGKETFCVKA